MSTPSELPASMKAWQFKSVQSGLEKSMYINDKAPLPKPKKGQHLVKVIAAALNPVDYKTAEIPLMTRLAAGLPATPGIDFVGQIVTPAAGSSLTPGQLVFGAAGASLIAGGSLAEYAVAKTEFVAPVPEGVDPKSVAGLGIAGVTAYQCVVPYYKNFAPGSRIFINGGSGGTGMFGIQFAKAAGYHVTTSCSTGNVELCKSLGADEVIDYKKQDVVATLRASNEKFVHVVDNVGHDPKLYFECHHYTEPKAKFVAVGGEPSLQAAKNFLAQIALPGFLGGGRRGFRFFAPEHKSEDLEQIGRWIQEGKVKPQTDSTFAFNDAPKAYEKLKTGRARGKVIVEIAKQT